MPDPDHSELPALWWDAIADKCLLLGIYKHGEEEPQLDNPKGETCATELKFNSTSTSEVITTQRGEQSVPDMKH